MVATWGAWALGVNLGHSEKEDVRRTGRRSHRARKRWHEGSWKIESLLGVELRSSSCQPLGKLPGLLSREWRKHGT